MSEEKVGSSFSSESARPKHKKKYLYLDNFNKYTAQQETVNNAAFHAVWKFSFIHGLVTLSILGAVLYLLIKS